MVLGELQMCERYMYYQTELRWPPARMLTDSLHGPDIWREREGTSWPMPAYPSASGRWNFCRVTHASEKKVPGLALTGGQ